MQRCKSTTKLSPEQKDAVWEVTKKATLVNFMFPLLAACVSYAAYADDLAVSEWPWKVGLLVALVCIFLPFAVSMVYRNSNLLWVCGLVLSIAMFAVYFFFGIFAYFFYFLFAPMAPLLRWPGLVGGLVLTLYWAVTSRRTVMHTITKTSFVRRAFEENAVDFRYRRQAGMALFEKLTKERSPFPKIYSYVVFGIAPFYLVASRLLSSNFGANGVLFVLAALSMPVSLWLAGMIIRIYLVMVSLPRMLEKEHHKPVLVAD